MRRPFTGKRLDRRRGVRVLAIPLIIAGLLVGSVPVARASSDAGGPTLAAQTTTCTSEVGPGIPPPTSVATGIPGYHAAWYGQSGYPTLCPGESAIATVAFMNSGTLGWALDQPGQTAYLGTWFPEPGQDRASALGGPENGWPASNRVAVQPAPYVGPGQVAWFQFAVRAPLTPGVHRLALRPLIEGAQWLEDYGVFWYVTVKASDAEVPRLVERTYRPTVLADGSRSIRVPALMYHYVGWLPADADKFRLDLTVSPYEFEGHLRYLRDNGYNTITTQDLWWALDSGGALPPNPVLLSFDDGYVDAYETVLPLLQRYGMVGSFSITTNLVDRPGHLTRDMVRALADAGMDIVSHAVDHKSLNMLAYEDQVHQLCGSRRILEDWTGREIRHLIYPSGGYLPLPYEALTSCGYLSAYRKSGGSEQLSTEILQLRRSRVRGQQGLSGLLNALAQ